MICGNCGAQNTPDQRFCDNCGKPLTADCPVCGHANRPSARFCGNCGTQLAVEAPPGPSTQDATQPRAAAERRLVSVLFADLVGFTPFAEERDAEQVRDVLERYFDTARTVIERHGGTVEKFIGDAVMAVWGTPVAHEDDAERAVRAALELVTAVKAMDASLDTRAAVLTGEAAVNLGATDQGLLAGDLVNTAARLQSVAQPATVLVGESTKRAASAAIAFEPAGEQALKGKQAPVPAWRALRVVGELGGRSKADSIEPPFVGRDAELMLLKDLLHATTREGRARLVAVSGPAGIGKSRLAWELEKYLDGLVEPFYWHRGRSPSYGEGISFWALGEMVRRRCRLAESDDEATTRERVAATVNDYVETEVDRRWVEPALLALLGVEDPPAGGRDVLFAAWRIFFENIARRGTTVLLFEDLQFADSGLLDFIDYLLEWSKTSPMLVLALARPELLERRPTFGSATRHFHSVPLEPLPDEQMRALLEGIVPDLGEQAVSAIVARADGIPLYAVETIRMLIADGQLEACDDGTCKALAEIRELAIPDTLRSLIASRLDSLDPTDRGLLQQAAVLGQTFSLATLAAVSDTPADELAARARPLVRREILAQEVDPRSPEHGQYRFVQGLIREVAYGTLSRRERRERHLAAARHFEALGDEETAGALASHYLAARQASEPGPEADAVATQARLALRAAAERASSLGAYGQAIAYLEQALAVTHDVSDRADLLERAAVAAEADARYEHGIELARQAAEAYESVGDRLGVARARALLGTLFVDSARQGDAIEAMTGGLAMLPEGADEIRAEISARLARAYMRSRQDELAIAAAETALTIAEHRGLTLVIAEALTNKGSALGNTRRWREGAALLELAASLAEQAGESALQLRALNNLATTIGYDDPLRAIRIGSEALSLAHKLGLRGMVNWLSGSVAYAHFWHGNWDAAFRLLDQALEEVGNETDRGRLLAIRLNFSCARGEATDEEFEALHELIELGDDPVARAWTESQRGDVLLSRGELEAAHETYERAMSRGVSDLELGVGLLRAAIWLRDPERVAAALAALRAQPHSGRVATVTRTWGEAALAAVEGRREEALGGFRSVVADMRDLEMEFEVARVSLDAFILLPGEPDARALAEEARQVFERLRARPYLERLDAELAAAGEAPVAAVRESPGTARRAAAGSDQR